MVIARAKTWLKRPLPLCAAVFAAALLGDGLYLDSQPALSQFWLWLLLHFASLGGAALGLACARRTSDTVRCRPKLWLHLAAAFLAWRLAYFPLMVFSGHAASLGEWLLLALGFPPSVWPLFLLTCAALHSAAAFGACRLLQRPPRWLRFAAAPALAVALYVSFLQPADIRPLPDTFWRLPPQSAAPAEAAAPALQQNPYLSALVAPGYWPNQRVILLAAGLTYETLPPSPWATVVRDQLEMQFRAQPRAATRARVLEHYLAYHAAQKTLAGAR